MTWSGARCDTCGEPSVHTMWIAGQHTRHACGKHTAALGSTGVCIPTPPPSLRAEAMRGRLACAISPPPDLNASGTSPHPPSVDEKPSGPPGGITSEGQAAYPRNDVLVREPPMCCGKPTIFRDSAPPYKGYECPTCRTYHSVLEEGAALTPLRTRGEQVMIDAGAPWTCPACHNQRGPSDFDGLTTPKKWDTDCWACGSKSAPLPPVSQQVGALPDTKSVEARIAGLKAASARVTATVRESVAFWDEPSKPGEIKELTEAKLLSAMRGGQTHQDLADARNSLICAMVWGTEDVMLAELAAYEESLFAEFERRQEKKRKAHEASKLAPRAK